MAKTVTKAERQRASRERAAAERKLAEVQDVLTRDAQGHVAVDTTGPSIMDDRERE
jgi:hypothetical protein